VPTCTKVARGIANPAVVPPFAVPATPSVPFDDVTDANPCGEYTVATVNAVDVSSHALCYPHLVMKLGWAAINGPVVISTS
jgi:hypothetical protein